MFKNLLRSLSKAPLTTPPKYFFSIHNTVNSTQILDQHIKAMKSVQFNSTRLKPPASRFTRIEGKRLQDLGFLRSFGDFAKSIEVYTIEDTPQVEGTSTPSASWVGINFPLKADPYIRNSFKKFYSEGVRTGRLIEILDLIGASTAYRYLKLDILSQDATVVTLCVDHFQIFEEVISTDQDLFISSYVSWVGNTSLEVRVDVTYTNIPDKLVASAYYVFASREFTDYSKPKKVPKLIFEGEDDVEKCILRFEYGKMNQKTRREAVEKSTFKVSPSSEESQFLHKLFKETLQPDFKDRYKPIPETSVEKTLLMHLQDKNVHGKIFGGYIMKEAADLAWVSAYLHGNGDYPGFVHIDDIAFLSPVEIGSVGIFKSWITYVEDNLSHVMITVDTIKGKHEKHRTCEIHMTLAHASKVTPVIPLSYFDGMAYIEGQRRVNNMRSI